MALTDNLVSYWKFDEASGDAADSTATGNTLTNNAVALYTAGKINNGVNVIKITSQFMSHADNASLSITGDFSASFWYKPNGTLGADTGECLFGKWGGTTQRSYNTRHRLLSGVEDIIVSLNSSGGGGGTLGQWLTTLSDGVWYHLVFVYDNAGTCDLYKNNVALTQATSQATSLFDSSEPFRVGAAGDNSSVASDFANGQFDEFGLWDRTLSSGEVSQLYNSGNGLAYPFTGNAATKNFLLVGVGT